MSGAGSNAAIPRVFLITLPAELISVQGNPIYTSVAPARSWLQNTEADVVSNGPQWPQVLPGGRTLVHGAKPGRTMDIRDPEASRGLQADSSTTRVLAVLASIPGTQQAAEAILLSQVPQTAREHQGDQGPDVEFQGDPMFEAIATTKVSRAVNTDKDILKVGDLYYMCFQGVWFVRRAARPAVGSREDGSKRDHEIPASSPAHNVTYVTVVEDDDDEWVTCAAVAGYTGMMVAHGCVVWGSGWYYPPYVWYGGFYPVYYRSIPLTDSLRGYNPWTGAYGRGAAHDRMAAWVQAHVTTLALGTYSRSAVAWGPYGARGVGSVQPAHRHICLPLRAQVSTAVGEASCSAAISGRRLLA